MKIETYPVKTDPIADDLIVGTDSEDKDATVNFLISDLITLFATYVGISEVKQLKGVFNQTGTSAPTLLSSVINTLGEVPVLTREDVGKYYITTVAPIFTIHKTLCFAGSAKSTATPSPLQYSYDHLY